MLINKGEIYELGNHRLACGDCRDRELVNKLIGQDRISLILTDPPFGVGYVENKKGFCSVKKNIEIINDDIKSEDDYSTFTSSWLSAVSSYLAEKSSFYVFNGDKMIFALKKGIQDADFRLAQILVWIKNSQVIGRRDYLAKHELIAYGWHGTHRFYKSKDKSVFFYPKPNKSPLHPTTKPAGLIRRLLLNSTKIGDVVYEPFCGSGTTLIACQQTERRCLAIEIDPNYCQTIIERLNKLKGEE